MENYFVVYLHKSIDGYPFYVGHGRLRRVFLKETATSKPGFTKRGAAYSEKVKSLDFIYDVEIVDKFLLKEDAIAFEQIIYDKYKDTLVNKTRPSSFVLMDDIDFSKFVCYDITSPTFLKWVIEPSRKIKIGRPAGTLREDGYYFTRINGQSYPNHRIIASLFGMKIDGKVVDHIDRVRHNNHIDNIRVIDQAGNSKNKSNNKKLKSSSGITGVTLSAVKYKETTYTGWVAEWRENGRHKSKYFKFTDENKYEVLLEAKKYREMKVAELGYSVFHGDVTPSETPVKLNLCFEQYDKITNELVAKYTSISDLINRNPSFKPGPIYAVCNGKKKSYRGYLWRSFSNW